MHTLYGIQNCDTVKKARKWLDDHGIRYRFHDYRSDGLDAELLDRLEAALGWNNMLNRRSTTWRQIDAQDKADLDTESAKALMLRQPTLIRRPVLDTGTRITIGFSADQYEAEL